MVQAEQTVGELYEKHLVTQQEFKDWEAKQTMEKRSALEKKVMDFMQKILGEQGIGSLCEEMMRTWAKRCREGQEGAQEAPKKEDHGKENSNGSVK